LRVLEEQMLRSPHCCIDLSCIDCQIKIINNLCSPKKQLVHCEYTIRVTEGVPRNNTHSLSPHSGLLFFSTFLGGEKEKKREKFIGSRV
jgi:hypothetical protein